ncbi:hypothetical protein LC605_31725 [Nostoc sp. CHAB 5836]|uniref:hypothetical protein n=1 Tax=Nostoc sp. CHAB 5836 TaxID=2780404 RepID=UPI001E58DF99|nr:hypothetical protein [Nostoc sp. CHAB 5836]MCC5619540.1 hypothetical protein [Nostoc sp. CHAB 5836]
MTHRTYTQQALQRYNLPRLKRIAAELGVTPTGDKRGSETWINAIIAHQSAHPEQFITPASIPLTPIEISFYDHEYYAGDKLIAAISYDDDKHATLGGDGEQQGSPPCCYGHALRSLHLLTLQRRLFTSTRAKRYRHEW